MFRNTVPVTEPAPVEVGTAVRTDLIPLSVLALDLGEPVTGWEPFLTVRGITVLTDDIGREAISRDDARRLILEKQEDETLERAKRAENERQAVEQDHLRRAQIWTGIPAIDLPYGVSASSAMLAAAHDAQPKRTSVLHEALSGESLTYHSYQTSPAGES